MSAPSAVYLLCLLASLVCAGLLVRAYRQSRSALTGWTAVGFAFLALNNLFLVGDMIVFPDVDLRWLRQASAFAAVAVLLFGFVRESE